LTSGAAAEIADRQSNEQASGMSDQGNEAPDGIYINLAIWRSPAYQLISK
jgi:hypothetical protein